MSSDPANPYSIADDLGDMGWGLPWVPMEKRHCRFCNEDFRESVAFPDRQCCQRCARRLSKQLLPGRLMR